MPVWLEARYSLMAPGGDKVDLLILLVEGYGIDGGTCVAFPLSPVGSGVDYMLVAVEPAAHDLHLADVLCLSFARGTMITWGDESRCTIETLTSAARF